jgi:hypothetical protein
MVFAEDIGVLVPTVKPVNSVDVPTCAALAAEAAAALAEFKALLAEVRALPA